MRSTLLVSTCIVAISLFTGCVPGSLSDNEPKEKLVLGTVKGPVYSNSYFGITMPSPEGWEIVDQEPLKTARPFDADLFQAFEYPVDSGYIDNAGIYLMAERRNHDPFMDDGGDYLQELKDGLEMLSSDGDRFSVISKTTLGGKEFHKLETYSIDTENDVETFQEFYATPIKGYWLLISLTYSYDNQKEKLKEMLDGIKFK